MPADDPLAGLDLRQGPESIAIDILVAPRASRARLGPVVGDRLKVAVTAAPVEGRANAAVVDLFSRELGLRRGDIVVIAGERNRRKTVRIAGVGADELRRVLAR